ncbi:MAG: AAA family ATPase [Methanomicrobiales archaeon]|nr:AAA family ATPase [Methanomicrobiales archaeon]
MPAGESGLLSGTQKRMLFDIASHVKRCRRRTLLNAPLQDDEKEPPTWVLFTGNREAQITAVKLLSYITGLNICRIDPATVATRYIREAEKNLDRIFADAEASQVILFFDEADTLFGKKTWIRDPGGPEVSSGLRPLLKRMERYPGIILLSAPAKDDIDPDVLRRVTYVADFKGPGAEPVED